MINMKSSLSNVSIIGTGHIARDLYKKIDRTRNLNLHLVAGRNIHSEGSKEAANYSKYVSEGGIDSILENIDESKIILDCTSASSHKVHHDALQNHPCTIIDLTPSGIGIPVIPSINQFEAKNNKNVSLISCGGQSSIPLLSPICRILKSNNVVPQYVEIASSIASRSAGMATRQNIDNYINLTTSAVEFFCKTKAKVILNINPAEPAVTMQTAMSILINDDIVSEENLLSAIEPSIKYIQNYLKGYQLVVPPTYIDRNRIFLSVRVEGNGDHLPKYSGNLDIITSAAVEVARQI